jgi:Flp pilus assembly protein TadB
MQLRGNIEAQVRAMFEDKNFHDAAAQTQWRANTAHPRLAAIDRALMVLGREVGNVILIALTLAILCAPVGFGLAAAWAIAAMIGVFSGSPPLGWLVGIVAFAFLCRYVWGTRLQSAARRAAAALVASRT